MTKPTHYHQPGTPEQHAGTIAEAVKQLQAAIEGLESGRLAGVVLMTINNERESENALLVSAPRYLDSKGGDRSLLETIYGGLLRTASLFRKDTGIDPIPTGAGLLEDVASALRRGDLAGVFLVVVHPDGVLDKMALGMGNWRALVSAVRGYLTEYVDHVEGRAKPSEQN